jgi:hypothetical protein
MKVYSYSVWSNISQLSETALSAIFSCVAAWLHGSSESVVSTFEKVTFLTMLPNKYDLQKFVLVQDKRYLLLIILYLAKVVPYNSKIKNKIYLPCYSLKYIRTTDSPNKY